ncbi:MAG TPA: peptidylprolyl isomerase [Chryseosolibacter sp.]|nr:peptidylprolyl isomerase [Chryseosolibacter sp.]
MKYLALPLLLVICLGCDQNKPTTVVDPQHVKEDLMRYAEANPENEVIIETSYGNIRVRLYEETPLHRANFIKNIKDEIYEGAEFYRIYYQFMIQAGIYPKELKYTIPAEFNRKYIHKKGALSMARSDEDNPDLESSSTEFFIVHGSTYKDYQVEQEIENLGLTLTPEQKQIYMTEGGYMSLDQQYTTFGEVIDGFDVIDKIAAVKVYSEDKPLKKIPVTIRIAE